MPSILTVLGIVIFTSDFCAAENSTVLPLALKLITLYDALESAIESPFFGAAIVSYCLKRAWKRHSF